MKRFFNKKSNRLIVIIAVVILVLSLGLGIFLYTNTKNSTPEIPAVQEPVENSFSVLEEVQIELGSEITLADFINGVDTEAIEYYSIMLDPEIDSEAEFPPVGEYTVTINIGGMGTEGIEGEYTSFLKVVDTTAPELTIKEEVTITEGLTITPELFMEECADVGGACTLKFVDTDGNETTAPTSIGTHEVTILASDPSQNVTSKTAKLVITKKETTTSAATNNNTNTNSNKNNNSNTNKTNSNNTSGNTNSSSNSNTGNSNTGATTQPANDGQCVPTSQYNGIPVYYKFPTCINGSNPEFTSKQMELLNTVNDLFNSPVTLNELDKCNTVFGFSNNGRTRCYDNITILPVRDKYGYNIGFYFLFEMYDIGENGTSHNNGQVVGRAYVTSSNQLQWISKNY